MEKNKPKFYWNAWGIVQKDGDDGDQLQRLGFYYYGLALRRKYGFSTKEYDNSFPEDYIRYLSLHEVQKGKYIRGRHWNDPKDVSRDQLIPNIIAMSAYGLMPQLNDLLDNSIPKGICPNFDLMMPQHRGMVKRVLSEKGSLVDDLGLFGDIACVVGKSFNSDFCDDLNSMLLLIQALETETSATVRGAKALYLKRRPSLGSTQLGAKNPILGALAWYFREESGGCPGFVDLYEPIIDLIFYGKI